MRVASVVAIWFAVSCLATQAVGHGNPIQVDVADGRLTVANGLTLTQGYANLASDPHEDAAFDFGPNQKLRSVYPGFNIAGLSADAALQFEILSRPDYTTDGYPTRWLWFWEPTDQAVVTAPTDPRFDVVPLFGSGSVQVRESTMLAGPTLTMASPVGPFLGADQHLLIYELQNLPAAALGVYGVFARLTSPGLDPSEPFLLAFRHGVAAEDFELAAQAINNAALSPGDYDRDSDVDADDYAYWRERFGNMVTPFTSPDGSGNGAIDAADYVIWRRAQNTGSIALAVNHVPEPSVLVLAAMVGLLTATYRRRRTSGVARPIARSHTHSWRSILSAA
jgi:hypothetical protein